MIFAIALLQSTVPGVAQCSSRVCWVHTDDAGGEQRLLNWKKVGMGSSAGEKTCGGAARPAGREVTGEKSRWLFARSRDLGCHV